MGLFTAHITSEDISTVAGNIEEISSMGGAVYCTYCKLEISPVAVNTGNFLDGWGRLLHILQVRKFPQLLGQLTFILLLIGIYIAPFPSIKCSKALHIVIVNNALLGEPEKVCFETILEGLTRCRILQVLWKRIL